MGYEFWQQLNQQRANTGNVSDSLPSEDDSPKGLPQTQGDSDTYPMLMGDGCNSMRKKGGELVPKKIVSWQREMKVSAHPHASLVAKLRRKE